MRERRQFSVKLRASIWAYATEVISCNSTIVLEGSVKETMTMPVRHLWVVSREEKYERILGQTPEDGNLYLSKDFERQRWTCARNFNCLMK